MLICGDGRPARGLCNAPPVHRSGNSARGRSSRCRCCAAGCRARAGSTRKITTSPCASSATSTTALAREIASLLDGMRRRSFEVRFGGLMSFGGRKPRAIVAAVEPIQPLVGTAGRARATDAAPRARAGGAQVHAACHAGAPARFLQPRGRRISLDPRAGVRFRRSACRASCCSPRAPRSAAGPTWSRRIIRWRHSVYRSP